MQAFIIRRLLAVIPTLLFTSVIVFASIRLIPGDVVDLMLAQNDISTGTDRAVIEAALGLDKPIYEQYFIWVANALQGDFGYSLWQNTPVAEQLAVTLPITFELGFLALIVALTVAIPIAIMIQDISPSQFLPAALQRWPPRRCYLSVETSSLNLVISLCRAPI